MSLKQNIYNNILILLDEYFQFYTFTNIYLTFGPV